MEFRCPFPACRELLQPYIRTVSMSIAPSPSRHAAAYARACEARDARFDGIFFVGITTTRIYCRPVCPARISYPDNRRFFGSAAAAERAGFRPCLRCRPELAPGRALIDSVSRLAHTAAYRIEAGALNEHGVTDLARELGVSARHLRRALERELGVSPSQLAQTHRLLLARRLLLDTVLPVTQVAFASGFRSLRRFNAVFRSQYRIPPRALRRPDARQAGRLDMASDDRLRLTLSYRAPLAWDTMLAFLAHDAIPGMETVDGRRYGRTICVGAHQGVVFVDDARELTTPQRRVEVDFPGARESLTRPRRVANWSKQSYLNVDLSTSLVPVLMPLLARLRRLFDLDADPNVIDANLTHGGLTELVAERPGIRIPGAVDGFDVALRLLVGGRFSASSSAREAMRRVVDALGEPIDTGFSALSRLAPSAARVVGAGRAALHELGVAPSRSEAIVSVARLVAEQTLRLDPGSDLIATRNLLTEGAGVSHGLATLIVMRALSWPDAWPDSDPSLRRALRTPASRALAPRADRWRPWRAYGALHLLAMDR